MPNSYEEALIGRIWPNAQPRQPSVIEVAKNVLGRENYRVEPHGAYFVWDMGRWDGPLKIDGFVQAANRKLKSEGRPQLSANPNWVV